MTQPTSSAPVTSADSTLLHKWTVAVLGALGLILLLVIGATVAVAGVEKPAPRPAAQVVKVSGVKVDPVVFFSISPGIKPGPDGQLHDAFSQSTFYVHPGQAVKLVVHNTDDVPHAIISPEAGVNIVIAPGTHTYTLLVKHAGVFEWHCNQPCDTYSMAHGGYMMGRIVAA